MKILIAERSSGQPEYYTAIRTDNGLGVFPIAAKVSEVTAASDSFHQRMEHHHRFTADAIAIFADRTSVSAVVLVTDFLAVAAVILCAVSLAKSHNFYLEFILFAVPFIHICPPCRKPQDVPVQNDVPKISSTHHLPEHLLIDSQTLQADLHC